MLTINNICAMMNNNIENCWTDMIVLLVSKSEPVNV